MKKTQNLQNNKQINSKQRTGENNALPYNREYNTLIVSQILSLLLEVRPFFPGRNFKLDFIKNLLFLQSSLASTAGKEMRRVEEKRTREPNPFSAE